MLTDCLLGDKQGLREEFLILKYSRNRGLNWNYVLGCMLVPIRKVGLGVISMLR